MISAIARIYQPGVQADCALVALADQGKLKSTAFRTLAVRDSWFSDSIDTLGDRDSRERLRGLWIVELSELSALRRSELEHVKSFLSCRVDHYRPAYGRRSIDVPRSCVFCGTSNDESPFVDASGNRRFWPIRTGRIDLAALTRDRDLLWAESLTRYRANEKWWIDSEELEESVTREQEEAYDGGAVDELILA
jgi:putative DNA primase/helicase